MSLAQWYNDIPPVTRTLMTASFGLTLAGSFGMIAPSYMVLRFSEVVQGFQVRGAWRL